MALGTGTLTLNNSSVAYEIPNPTIENLSGDSDSSIALTTSQTLTLDSGSGAVTEFGGVIIGDVTNPLVKTGPGVQILDGADTYGGGTTISAGTLTANGSQAFGTGAVTVDSGATIATADGVTLTNAVTLAMGSTIGGNGAFDPMGGVTIPSGVAVRPFDGVTQAGAATLSFGSTLTFGPGGSYDFAVETASGPAGIGYSTIDVAGAFTVASSPGSPFTIDVSSLAPTSHAAGLANFNAMQSYAWTILSAASISGFSASDFAINTSAFQNGTSGGSFSLLQSGNTLTLDFNPVPEPSTWALIGVGAFLVGLAVRRRVRA
jgi:autotransporter-associated beta strand protein